MLSLILSASLLLPATQSPSAEGDHFAIICHFDSPAVAESALRAAEEVFPQVAEFYGGSDSPLERKLEIHLYSTTAAYETAEQALTGGRFKRNLSFSDWDSQSSHILVQPSVRPSVLEAVGLPSQTLRLICHEAAHIATYRLCPNFRAHPRWLSEGAAQWFERRATAALEILASAGDDPHYSTAMVRTQRLQKQGKLPDPRQILSGADLGLDFQDAYALERIFFEQLLKTMKPAAASSFGARIRQLAGGSSFSERLAKQVLAATGGAKSLKRRFGRSVKALEPHWDEVYRNLETAGPEWVQVAFPDKNAICWRTAAMDRKAWTLSGEFKILDGPKTQLNLLLDRNDTGFLQVCFGAAGYVTLLEYTSKTNQWRRIWNGEVALPLDTFHAFEVKARRGKLRLVLNGSRICEVDTKRRLTGPWGLGVLQGSVGIWRGVMLSK